MSEMGTTTTSTTTTTTSKTEKTRLWVNRWDPHPQCVSKHQFRLKQTEAKFILMMVIINSWRVHLKIRSTTSNDVMHASNNNFAFCVCLDTFCAGGGEWKQKYFTQSREVKNFFA